MSDLEPSAKDACRIDRDRLRARHPVALPRAEAAAAALSQQFGPKPKDVLCITGEVDSCGRPYVLVSISQWRSDGSRAPRLQDTWSGLPDYPKSILGVPVYRSIVGCFGQNLPGRFGQPCVQETGLAGLGQDDDSGDAPPPPPPLQIVPWKIALGVAGISVIAGGIGFAIGYWVGSGGASAAMSGLGSTQQPVFVMPPAGHVQPQVQQVQPQIQQPQMIAVPIRVANKPQRKKPKA
jgi:hypothetical protein